MPKIRVVRSPDRIDRPTADFDAYPQPGVIAADASGASPLFVTLPAATSMRAGEITIVNTGATGTVIVDTTGADTINGSATYTLASQYEAVTVESLGGSPGWVIATVAGGVTDHGALTGLADDDHLQYQRADSVFTTTSPYTITDESLLVTIGTAVTLPDAASNVGRMVSVGSAGSDVVISAAGTDTIFGAGSTFTLAATNGVTFVSIDIGGWGWAIINRRGAATDLPEWYGQGIADGNLVTLQTGAPAWTTGTRTAEEFLSGTGWTNDVPVLVPVKNTTAGTIAKGAPVYATGTVGATSTIEIAPADADFVATMPAIGLTNSSLAPNDSGYVTVLGTLKGLNTSAYAVNEVLYVSQTAGQLTATRPHGLGKQAQQMAIVSRVNNSTGELIVIGAGKYVDPASPQWDFESFGDTDYTIQSNRSVAVVQGAASVTAPRTVYLPKIYGGNYGFCQEVIIYSGAVNSTNTLTIRTADISVDLGQPPGTTFETIRTIASATSTSFVINESRRQIRLIATGNGVWTLADPTPIKHAASHQDGGSDELALDASQITAGTVATARLGTGTASASKFLRGDQTWDHVNPAPAFLTVSGDQDYGIPGWTGTSGPGASALSTGRLTFEPWWVWREVTIDRLAVEVTTAAAAGSLMRLGIYNCDTSWTPTSLVVDAGTIAVDPGTVPALQTVTVNVTLAPGRYMACWVTQGVPSARTHAGTVPTWPSRIGTAAASGSNVYRNSMYLASQSALVTGGLASTGTAPDTINASSLQYANYIVLARFA